MEAIIFTRTPWPISSDDKYSIVKQSSKGAIEAQESQRALAGSPEGTLSVHQLPSGPSPQIDPQTQDAAKRASWLMHRYRIYNNDYASHYSLLSLKTRTICEWMADGAGSILFHSFWFNSDCETELGIEVKLLLCADQYLPEVVNHKHE